MNDRTWQTHHYDDSSYLCCELIREPECLPAEFSVIKKNRLVAATCLADSYGSEKIWEYVMTSGESFDGVFSIREIPQNTNKPASHNEDEGFIIQDQFEVKYGEIRFVNKRFVNCMDAHIQINTLDKLCYAYFVRLGFGKYRGLIYCNNNLIAIIDKKRIKLGDMSHYRVLTKNKADELLANLVSMAIDVYYFSRDRYEVCFTLFELIRTAILKRRLKQELLYTSQCLKEN